MVATGIVRRIDDLGRINIPRDIRRALKIREGDPLEIYIDNGTVVFKKYGFGNDINDALKNLTEIVEELQDEMHNNESHAETAKQMLKKCNALSKELKNFVKEINESS